jgi:hypothetical protein
MARRLRRRRIAGAPDVATAPEDLSPAAPPDAYPPMTNRQKFAWTVGCVVDWKWILYSGARAGLDQWRNDPPEWKQGVGREFLPDLLKGDASRAVRNLGVPLSTPAPLPPGP